MKGGNAISPATAGVVIAVIVVIVGAVIWNMTGKKTSTVKNPDEMRAAVQRAMGSSSRPSNPGMPGMPSGGMGTTGGR